MAVPKKRRSKSKKRTKHAAWKITMPGLRPCPSCGAKVVPHRVCTECGVYKGKQIVTIKTKETTEKDS